MRRIRCATSNHHTLFLAVLSTLRHSLVQLEPPALRPGVSGPAWFSPLSGSLKGPLDRIFRGIFRGALFLQIAASGTAVQADTPAEMEQAREIAAAMPTRLMAVLHREIQAGGLAAAIEACSTTAPRMAASASERTGWEIRRVSLKNRSPDAVPDAWERQVLRDFQRRAAAGEDPGQLEASASVRKEDGTQLRYMKALPTQPLCLGCHGPREQLAPEVRERLDALYPEDRATGYSVGEIRGAVTLKRTQ